jgi:hypothetical protein
MPLSRDSSMPTVLNVARLLIIPSVIHVLSEEKWNYCHQSKEVPRIKKTNSIEGSASHLTTSGVIQDPPSVLRDYPSEILHSGSKRCQIETDDIYEIHGRLTSEQNEYRRSLFNENINSVLYSDTKQTAIMNDDSDDPFIDYLNALDFQRNDSDYHDSSTEFTGYPPELLEFLRGKQDG